MIKLVSYIKNKYTSDLYKIKLISDSIPQHLPVNGKDIIGIPNSARIEKGSELLVYINGDTQRYIYGDKGFILTDNEIKDDKKMNNTGLIISDDGTVYIN